MPTIIVAPSVAAGREARRVLAARLPAEPVAVYGREAGSDAAAIMLSVEVDFRCAGLSSAPQDQDEVRRSVRVPIRGTARESVLRECLRQYRRAWPGWPPSALTVHLLTGTEGLGTERKPFPSTCRVNAISSSLADSVTIATLMDTFARAEMAADSAAAMTISCGTLAATRPLSFQPRMALFRGGDVPTGQLDIYSFLSLDSVFATRLCGRCMAPVDESDPIQNLLFTALRTERRVAVLPLLNSGSMVGILRPSQLNQLLMWSLELPDADFIHQFLPDPKRPSPSIGTAINAGRVPYLRVEHLARSSEQAMLQRKLVPPQAEHATAIEQILHSVVAMTLFYGNSTVTGEVRRTLGSALFDETVKKITD